MRKPASLSRAVDLGTVKSDELLPLPVLRKRLGWGNRTAAEAQRAGLRCTPFGHFKYVLGADVLAWFAKLAGEQSNGGPGK